STAGSPRPCAARASGVRRRGSTASRSAGPTWSRTATWSRSSSGAAGKAGEEFVVQVLQVVGRGRAPERSLSPIGERGAEDPGREMACLGAKAPAWTGGSGRSLHELAMGGKWGATAVAGGRNPALRSTRLEGRCAER